MKTDVQRQKVYRWERKYVPRVWRQKVTELEAQELVAGIAAEYALVAPSVRFKRMANWAGTYQAHDNILTLNPRSGMDRGTIIHEMSHAVCSAWKKRLGMAVDDGGHGDFFMAAYLDVLARCGDLTDAELAAVRVSLDKASYTGAARRNVPKVAACAVYDDPRESADQARRSMRCVECNYPWIRHDMPFHKHECAERWLSAEGHHGKVLAAADLPPAKRRAYIVDLALHHTKDLVWSLGRWRAATIAPDGVPFRPTEPDHRRVR